jgi:hypothetical protein
MSHLPVHVDYIKSLTYLNAKLRGCCYAFKEQEEYSMEVADWIVSGISEMHE